MVRPDNKTAAVVGCGEVGESNADDDWLIEAGGLLVQHEKIKLVHHMTTLALHAGDATYPFPPYRREVTAVPTRSDGDYWCVCASRIETLADGLDDMQLQGPDEAPPFDPSAHRSVSPASDAAKGGSSAAGASSPSGATKASDAFTHSAALSPSGTAKSDAAGDAPPSYESAVDAGTPHAARSADAL